MSEKRLYKSADKKVCGVCGGIAEYFGIDPTIVRLVYVLLVLFTGIGILPYIIAAIVMEDSPENTDYKRIESDENSNYTGYVYDSDEPVGFKVDSVNNNDVNRF